MDNEEDVQEQKYIPTSPISDFSGYHGLTQQDLAKIHANSSSGSKMVKSTDSDSDLEILGEEGISTPSSNTSKADVVANIRSQFAHSSNYEAPERKRGNLGHKHSAAQIKILEARFQQIRAEEKRDGRKQRAHLCREDKQDLCKKTGLTDLQVRLWFMNRRRKQLKSEQKATLRLLDPESALLNPHNLSAHPEITILDPPATTSMPAAINPKPQTSYITVVPRTPSTNVSMGTHLGGLQANIQKLAVLASQVPQVSSTAPAISSIQRPPVRETNFNAKLKVGSRLFAVNKENLTKSSKYFEALFLIHSKDPSNANNPVEVNGVDSGDLEHFLSALRTDGLSITSENVCTLLKLSDRFDVPSLLTKCETFLGSNKCRLPIMVKIRLSDQYGLKKLMAHCSVTFESLASFKASTSETDLLQLSDSSKARLFERIVKLI